MADPFTVTDDEFDGYVQARQNEAVRRAMPTEETDPDKAARSMELSDYTGLHPALVRGNLDNVEDQFRSQLTNQLIQRNRHLQDYVNSHPLAAEISSDDWGNLDNVSQSVQKFEPQSMLAKGIHKFREILDKPFDAAVGAAAEGFGSERLGSWIPQQDYEELQKSPQGRINYALAALLGSPVEVPMRGFNALTHTAGAIAEHVGGLFGADERGAKQVGAETETMVGLGIMHLGSTGVHVPPELNAIATRAHKTAEAIKPYVDAGVEPPLGVDPAIDQVKAKQAEIDADALKEALTNAQKSNTRERNPEMFSNFIRQHTDAEIGIPGDIVRKLYGDSVPMPDDGLLGFVPGIEDQLIGTDHTGGDVKIPLADWLANVEPEVAKVLHDHIRVRGNGLTLDEAKNLPKPLPEEAPAVAEAEPKTEIEQLRARLNGETPKPMFQQEVEQTVKGVEAQAGLGPKVRLVRTEHITEGDLAGTHEFDLLDRDGNKLGDAQITDQGKNIHVDYMRAEKSLWSLGPSVLQDAMKQLREAFPEAKTISGVRVSGARDKIQEGIPPGERDYPVVKRSLYPLSQEAHQLLHDVMEPTARGEADEYVDRDGIRHVPTTLLTENEAKVAKAVDDTFKKIAPRLVEVKPARKIQMEGGGRAFGVFADFKSRIPMIMWSLETPDAVGTARHEIIHHLRRTGFILKSEWALLRDAAIREDWIGKYNIAKRYKGESLGLMIEEAVAEHFAHWNRNEYVPGVKEPPGGWRGVMYKISQLYYGLRESIRGALGKEVDWKDLFTKIEKGEVGARRGVEPLAEDAYRGPTYEEGEREVLYHGTSKDKPFKGFKFSRNGTWFTTDPKEASQYAIENDSMKVDLSEPKPRKVNTASRVIPAHHNFEKTKVVSELPHELKYAENYRKAQSEYFDKLRAEGYDSFRIKGDKGHDVVVSLDNTKLKPAYAGRDKFDIAMQAPEQGELDVTRVEDKDLFAKANALGMTVKSYKKYLDLMEKKDREDTEFAKAQNLKQVQRRQTEEWKAREKAIREEVRPDYENRPDLAADKFLREGVLYGDKIKGRPKLDSTKLTTEQKGMLPDDYHTPGGIHPDDAAGLFGYDSGESLVNRLAELHKSREASKLSPARYLSKLVDDEVERRMRVEHGDLAQNILDEAQEHVISQTQFDMLHEETLALATKAGMEMSLTKEDMKAMAKQGFDRLNVKQAGMEEHLRNALRANELAERALLDGDPKEAFRQKQKQLFSFLYAREAKALEREQKKFNRLVKTYTARSPSGREPEYTNYIHEIMQRFGIGVRRTPQDIATEITALGHGDLKAFIESKNSDYGALWVDERLYDPSFKKPIGEMNVDEFRAVNNAMISLDKASRDEKKVYREGAKEDLAKVIDQGVTQLETRPLKEYSLKEGRLHALSSLAKKYMTVGILNAETWVDRFDRGNIHGMFNQWLMRPLSTAANRENTIGRQFSKMFRDLGDVKDADKLVSTPLIDPLTITRDDEAGRPYSGFTRKNLAAMISNAGNEYNWDVLTKGHNADPDFLKQWLISKTTKADWIRAEKMGKMFQEAFEQAQQVYRNIYGVAPPKIELKPFDVTFPNGDTFHSEGWYHPIIKDEKRTNFVRSARGEDLLDKDRGLFPSIANGYTKRRTGAIDVLSLDHDMVVPRLNQIIHDIAFRQEIIEAAKIVKNKEFRKALRQYAGDQFVPMFDSWLQNAAGATNIQTGLMADVSRASNYARTNVIGSLIGFNPGTVLKHGPTALVNSMWEVGLRQFAKSFAEVSFPHLREAVSQLFLGDESTANQLDQFIMENSEEIRRRERNWQETIGGAAKIVEGKSTLRDKIIYYGSKPVALSDMISAKPTWLAAYMKEMEETGIHGDAVYAGDKAVRRAHGSTAVTNLPELVHQAGPFGSWVTTLYGFFSTQMQRRAEIAFKLNDTYHLAKEGEIKAATKTLGSTVPLMFAAVIWPTIVEELVTGIGTDDHRGYLTRSLYAALGGVASSFLYFRDLAHGVATGQEPSVGMASTPAHDFANVFKEITHPVKALDRNHAAKTVSDFITVFGEATGLAPRQVAKVVRFGMGTALGTEKPKGPEDVGVGLMRGTAKRRVER